MRQTHTITIQPDTAVRRARPGTHHNAATATVPSTTLSFATAPKPIAVDRWRLVEQVGVTERWFDPYNRNVFKGDRPIVGNDWFLDLSFLSLSAVEATRSGRASGVDKRASEKLSASVTLFQGRTAFRPPTWQLRAAAVAKLDSARGDRTSLTELFVERHLWNRSDAYDFDSVRIGVQPFISDPRGLLLRDEPLGVRLFGNLDSNRTQYNVAWLRRFEKDVATDLNRGIDLRHEDIWAAVLYEQDWPVPGFRVSSSLFHVRGDEPSRDDIGSSSRYRVNYLGIGGDGHLGRVNLLATAYLAWGRDDDTGSLRSWLVAAEASWDFSWYRVGGHVYVARGDGDADDGRGRSFAPISDRPEIAGSAPTFFLSRAITRPDGRLLTSRDRLLVGGANGSSRFSSPGLQLAGVHALLDVAPQVSLQANVNAVALDQPSTLFAESDATDSRFLGIDVGMVATWRPLFDEHIVIQMLVQGFAPGDAYRSLIAGDVGSLWSMSTQIGLRY